MLRRSRSAPPPSTHPSPSSRATTTRASTPWWATSSGSGTARSPTSPATRGCSTAAAAANGTSTRCSRRGSPPRRPDRLLTRAGRRGHQGPARRRAPAHRDRLRKRSDGHRRHGGRARARPPPPPGPLDHRPRRIADRHLHLSLPDDARQRPDRMGHRCSHRAAAPRGSRRDGERRSPPGGTGGARLHGGALRHPAIETRQGTNHAKTQNPDQHPHRGAR